MEGNFIEQLKDVFEIEDREIQLSDNFRDYDEWDSLANLSLIAMIDEEYGVVIPNSEFKEINTVGQLLEEIKKRK